MARANHNIKLCVFSLHFALFASFNRFVHTLYTVHRYKAWDVSIVNCHPYPYLDTNQFNHIVYEFLSLPNVGSSLFWIHEEMRIGKRRNWRMRALYVQEKHCVLLICDWSPKHRMRGICNFISGSLGTMNSPSDCVYVVAVWFKSFSCALFDCCAKHVINVSKVAQIGLQEENHQLA